MKVLTLGLITTLALGLLAAPLAADAQQGGKMPRIGVLQFGTHPDPYSEAFAQGLRDLGYVPGKNIILEYRWAEGRFDRLPDLAAELVGLKVDIIVTVGTQTTDAAKQATGTIPIVMTAASDPVGSGFVASRARPAGNITGFPSSPRS